MRVYGPRGLPPPMAAEAVATGAHSMQATSQIAQRTSGAGRQPSKSRASETELCRQRVAVIDSARMRS